MMTFFGAYVVKATLLAKLQDSWFVIFKMTVGSFSALLAGRRWPARCGWSGGTEGRKG